MNDLNPFGKVFFPEIVPDIVNRFHFQTYPIKPEDFEEEKGIKFANGVASGVSVDKLTIWRDGITLDTRAGTSIGKLIIEDSLTWLSDKVGLDYSADKIARWAYLSNLAFFSEVDLTAIHPSIKALTERLSPLSSLPVENKPSFELVSLSIDFDKTNSKLSPAAFKIERRGGSPFSHNKYFSEAPIQTQQHIDLLEEFEAGLIG